MLDTVQLYAGLVVLRKTPFALRFLREWLAWATEGELITDAWQPTRQHRSRREAICTKNTAWHATTFGSHGKFADLARMKCRRAAQVRPVISTCTNLTLQDLPPRWAKANGATRGSRGAGYWRWKPYTLLRRLQALGDEEVLVHFDYDLAIGHNLSALYCLGQNAPRGVVTFHFPCWTDRG